LRRLLLGAALLAGCTTPGPRIDVRNAYAYQPVLGDVGAAYFAVTSHGAADTIAGVDVQGAVVAMIHEQAVEGGQEVMRHVGALPVPAESTVTLRPGGLHLMIEGFQKPPVAGDTLTITIHFVRAGAVVVRAPVLAYGTEP
jgi:periplasmic copper chaperone A